jgi:hypothetical protein
MISPSPFRWTAARLLIMIRRFSVFYYRFYHFSGGSGADPSSQYSLTSTGAFKLLEISNWRQIATLSVLSRIALLSHNPHTARRSVKLDPDHQSQTSHRKNCTNFAPIIGPCRHVLLRNPVWLRWRPASGARKLMMSAGSNSEPQNQVRRKHQARRQVSFSGTSFCRLIVILTILR